MEKFGDIGAVEMLLNEVIQNKVGRNKYGEIEKFGFSERNDERIRLFVALGSADGLDAKKLVAFVEEQTGVEASNVTNVRVFDRFSFFDVPRLKAELIVKELNRTKGRRGKKLVDFAKTQAGRSKDSFRGSKEYMRKDSKKPATNIHNVVQGMGH